MNARWLVVLAALWAVVLGGCGGGAASPTEDGSDAGESVAQPRVVVTRLVEGEAVEVAEMEPTAEPMMAAEADEMAQAAVPTPENQFQDYGVNPFVDTAQDGLSTFALDVDTASYTVARRYVTDGSLPPAEAVRVEEFINYFNQEYAPPTDSAFALYADGAPSPFAQDGTHLLRIGIQGYTVPEAERPPTALTLVIDVSGSMDMENRLGLVKQSLQLLVDRLRPTDTVAIVVYSDQTRVVLEPTSAAERGAILDAIYALQPEGSTNAEAGLRLGYELASRSFLQGGLNRVILLSDGVANVGATGPEEILRAIRQYADQGITLTSVGVGMGNFNDVLMEQLANDGDGHYAYIDTLDEAERLFVTDLTSTLQVIALNAKVQVAFNPEVVARYRLLGYENRAVADDDFRDDTVDAGEIGAGHTVTALYAVQVNPGGQGRIATVQLRWEEPDTGTVQEMAADFSSAALAPSFEASAPRYQLAVAVAHYAEFLRQSPFAEATTLDQLSALAERVAAQLGNDPDVAEFATLVQRASQLSQ